MVRQQRPEDSWRLKSSTEGIRRLYGAVFRPVLACEAIPFYMQPLNPQYARQDGPFGGQGFSRRMTDRRRGLYPRYD
ncbi:hypothetical protein SAMN05421750_103236 [Agrobacterium pusense]|nr:hypothetical protein SAMN05421750_103236 [Agrobacterium pusense]